MDTAVQYADHMDRFLQLLSEVYPENQMTAKVGRRFDRILLDGATLYFVDRHSWDIYGAKSSFQFNPRRWYGTMADIQDVNWNTGVPSDGTSVYERWMARETEILQQYKPRGRPRKNPVAV